MLSQTGLPTLELALTHTEKEEEGGNKGPLMKALNPAPPPPPPRSHSSPPSSFPPCPVELIWQRGGSISQFTQAAAAAAASFFFSCRAFFCSPCLCLPPPPPSTSLFFVCPCLPMFPCTVCVCYSTCKGRWNNIGYSKVEDGPNPRGCQHLTQAVRRRCRGTGINTIPPPVLVCPHLLCSLSPLNLFVSFHSTLP